MASIKNPREQGALEVIQYIIANIDVVGECALEHLTIASVAVGFAILTGVSIGIAITQNERARPSATKSGL